MVQKRDNCPSCASLEVVAEEVMRELESEITAPLALAEGMARREMLKRAAAKLREALALPEAA